MSLSSNTQYAKRKFNSSSFEKKTPDPVSMVVFFWKQHSLTCKIKLILPCIEIITTHSLFQGRAIYTNEKWGIPALAGRTWMLHAIVVSGCFKAGFFPSCLKQLLKYCAWKQPAVTTLSVWFCSVVELLFDCF